MVASEVADREGGEYVGEHPGTEIVVKDSPDAELDLDEVSVSISVFTIC